MERALDGNEVLRLTVYRSLLTEANMLVMIDNYDSFTYNLVQYFGQLGEDIKVFRNDQIDLAGLEQTQPTRGVCLGHQAIGAAFGGKVIRSHRLMHGKTSLIYHDGIGLFQGIPSPFEATRYHSLIVERESLPECLVVSAQTSVGEIMGFRHQTLAVYGVQFHPESILTGEGLNLLRNFLKRQRG
jgi:anthranilate/para-aminobenzoate synthase component II